MNELTIIHPKEKSGVATFDYSADAKFKAISDEIATDVYGGKRVWDVYKERLISRRVKPKIPTIFRDEIKAFIEDLGKLGFTEIEPEVDSNEDRIIFRAKHVIPSVEQLYWKMIVDSEVRYKRGTVKYRNLPNTERAIVYSVKYGEYIRGFPEPRTVVTHPNMVSLQYDIANIQRAIMRFIGSEDYYSSGSRSTTIGVVDIETHDAMQKKKEIDEHIAKYERYSYESQKTREQIVNLNAQIAELMSNISEYETTMHDEMKWLEKNGVSDRVTTNV